MNWINASHTTHPKTHHSHCDASYYERYEYVPYLDLCIGIFGVILHIGILLNGFDYIELWRCGRRFCHRAKCFVLDGLDMILILNGNADAKMHATIQRLYLRILLENKNSRGAVFWHIWHMEPTMSAPRTHGHRRLWIYIYTMCACACMGGEFDTDGEFVDGLPDVRIRWGITSNYLFFTNI